MKPCPSLTPPSPVLDTPKAADASLAEQALRAYLHERYGSSPAVELARYQREQALKSLHHRHRR